MHCYWWKEWIMAAITGPCICKQLWETSPITLKRKKKNTKRLQLCVPLCLHQLIPLFFPCGCQSQQKVFLRAVYLSPHFLLAQLLITPPLSLQRRWTKVLLCSHVLFTSHKQDKTPSFAPFCKLLIEKRTSFNLSIAPEQKERVDGTVGSPSQACGLMIYLGKFWCQFNFATCHLCWMGGCL